MNCQSAWLSTFLTARETFLNSFPFFDRVFVLHRPRFTPLMYQVTKFFCPRCWFAMWPSAKIPRNLWFACKPRNWCVSESESKYCASLILDATSTGRSRSESWEKCTAAGTSAASRLSAQSNFSLLDWCPSFWFLFLILGRSPRPLDAWSWISSLRNLAGLGEILDVCLRHPSTADDSPV